MPPRLLPLVWRLATRARGRALLTVAGVALATFVAGVVAATREGARLATEHSAAERTLIVFRENRFCPFTSRLPQGYARRIAAIDGVESVVPTRILVSTCQASLDVVTFRGVPPDEIGLVIDGASVVGGGIEAWRARRDAALVGEALASRRGLSVGDRLSAAGVDVAVVGILASTDPQDRNTAFVQLAFLQETATKGGAGGVVTQFDVTVSESSRLEEVAQAIDAEFAAEPDPTATTPEKAFVARAAADVLEVVRFAVWLGLGSLVAVLALVGNAIALATHGRARDHAVMQTIGYRPTLVARLVVAEGIVLGVLGAVLGGGIALVVVTGGRLALTAEGMNVEAVARPADAVLLLALAVLLSVVASLPPAFRAAARGPADVIRSAG